KARSGPSPRDPTGPRRARRVAAGRRPEAGHTPGMADAPFDADAVAAWLRDAQQIVVLTGAGISTESGIPDFRGPQGLWTKNPDAEKAATLQYYVNDPEVRARAWQNR